MAELILSISQVRSAGHGNTLTPRRRRRNTHTLASTATLEKQSGMRHGTQTDMQHTLRRRYVVGFERLQKTNNTIKKQQNNKTIKQQLFQY